MSGEVKDSEIRRVMAALPLAHQKTASLLAIRRASGICYDRLIKVLLCMRAKGLAEHTDPIKVERRRWRATRTS